MRASFTSRGSFDKTEAFLKKIAQASFMKVVESEAQKGVDALSAATPRSSGTAAAAWGYEIVRGRKSLSIHWTNSDVENGYPVAVMIQYGHGTGTGGYVRGINYINPAMRPIFDSIAQTVWKAVTSA